MNWMLPCRNLDKHSNKQDNGVKNFNEAKGCVMMITCGVSKIDEIFQF